MTRELTFCSGDESNVELATETEETEDVRPGVCVFSNSLGPRRRRRRLW